MHAPSYHVNPFSSCFLHPHIKPGSWPPWRGWSPQEVKNSLPASLPSSSWSNTKDPSSQSQLPHPFPLLLSSQNLGSWHSSLLTSLLPHEGCRIILRRCYYMKVGGTKHSCLNCQLVFSLLEIFIISLLENLYFVSFNVLSLPMPSTAISF